MRDQEGWHISETFGSDFITITDEEGNDFELEYLDTLEIDGQLYMAFLPADMDVNDEDYGIVILKVDYEGDEELLVSIDDDDERDEVFARFSEQLFSDEEDDSQEDDIEEDETTEKNDNSDEND